MLDLSKIRAGKVALEALPIDLGQVLEECTSLFAGAAEGKGIELIVCPPAHAEQVLLGDPLRVRQILMNLVGNAVKFTSQGEVVVRADVDDRRDDRAVAKISVTDTGIGMDAAAVKRIFEPFSQADETTTRKFGGTGLGSGDLSRAGRHHGRRDHGGEHAADWLDVPSVTAVDRCRCAGRA